jgi:hypothetical protein
MLAQGTSMLTDARMAGRAVPAVTTSPGSANSRTIQ